MSKLFRGFFAKSVKTNYFCKVHEVTLPGMETIGDNDRFSVMFERGDRHTFAADQSPSFDYSGDSVDVAIEFDETLALDVTLYMDANGAYQAKDGLISVLQRKKGALGLRAGKEGFKTLGSVKVLLHGDYADGEPHEVTLPLQWCSAVGATIKMTITCNHVDGKPSTGVNKKAGSSSSSTAPSAKGKGKGKTESGYDASELEDMFTLPTSRNKKSSDEYVPWGDNEEEDIHSSNPWEQGDSSSAHAASWDHPAPASSSSSSSPNKQGSETAADAAFDEPDLVGSSDDDPFAPSAASSSSSSSSSSSFSSFSSSTAATKAHAFDNFAPSLPTVAEEQDESVASSSPTSGTSGTSGGDVFSSFGGSGSGSSVASPVEPKEAKAAPATTKAATKPGKGKAPAAGATGPSAPLQEIWSTTYHGDGQPSVRFKLTLPRDVKPGDTIKHIGGNNHINAIVPPHLKGGDTVVLVLPEDFNSLPVEGGENDDAPPSPAPAASKAAFASAPSSSSGTAAAAGSVGSDEYSKLQAQLREAQAQQQAAAQELAAYREKAEGEMNRLRAKQAATESLVGMASSQLSSSNKEDQATKAAVSNLQAELAALREKNSMLEALGAKASYYSSQVGELESVSGALKEELDREREDRLGLEARLRDLEAETGALHQQVLDSKLALVQLAAEADEAKRAGAVMRSRAQALAAKVASMEVAVVEAEILKAELAAGGNGHAEAKPPPMPSFLRKIAASSALPPASAAVAPAVPAAPTTPTAPTAPTAPATFAASVAPMAPVVAPVAASAPPRPNFSFPSSAAPKFPVPAPVAPPAAPAQDKRPAPALAAATLAPAPPAAAPAPVRAPVMSAPAPVPVPVPVPARVPDAHVAALTAKVQRFYQVHNPAKVGDVPNIVEKWKGRETELLSNLEQKYGKFEEDGEDEGLC